MGFAAAQSSLAEFASKPLIRHALANPFQPASVLSFFTGIDYKDPTSPDLLKQGNFIAEMSPLWFGGGPAYDELCEPFCPVIRAVGTPTLTDQDASWESTVDGKCAQLVLCDQLSRNCFRGTNEAFAYDHVGCTMARDLASIALSDNVDSISLEGEFYPPYAVFVTTALMHSEALEDHETCLDVLDWANTSSPQLKSWWDGQEAFEMEHKEIIDRFGRYPHRNAKLGRASTPQEKEWLSNDDALPGWAKSQM